MPNYHSEMGYHRKASGCEQGVHDLFFVLVVIVLPLWFIGALIKTISGKSRKVFSHRDMLAFERAEQVKKDLAAVQKMIGPDKGPAPDYSVTVTKPKPPAPSGGTPPAS